MRISDWSSDVCSSDLSWTPLEGPMHGFLVTHNESISMADYYSVKDGATVAYRPTVHYAYHPCDDAVLSLHEIAGKNWDMQPRSEEHTSELQSLMRISYAVFCLKKKKKLHIHKPIYIIPYTLPIIHTHNTYN